MTKLKDRELIILIISIIIYAVIGVYNHNAITTVAVAIASIISIEFYDMNCRKIQDDYMSSHR